MRGGCSNARPAAAALLPHPGTAWLGRAQQCGASLRCALQLRWRPLVDCSGKGLTAVPKGLSTFTQALDISMNNITQLPEDAFKNFPFLEELQLAGNDLSFIHPKALSELKELKVLMLQNNQLKTVSSEAIHGLNALQSLRLDANHITSVPEDSFEGLALQYSVFYWEA